MSGLVYIHCTSYGVLAYQQQRHAGRSLYFDSLAAPLCPCHGTPKPGILGYKPCRQPSSCGFASQQPTFVGYQPYKYQCVLPAMLSMHGSAQGWRMRQHGSMVLLPGHPGISQILRVLSPGRDILSILFFPRAGSGGHLPSTIIVLTPAIHLWGPQQSLLSTC